MYLVKVESDVAALSSSDDLAYFIFISYNFQACCIAGYRDITPGLELLKISRMFRFTISIAQGQLLNVKIVKYMFQTILTLFVNKSSSRNDPKH